MKMRTFYFAASILFIISISAASIGEEGLKHPEFSLLDYEGNEIGQGSTAPYSPKNTCGMCHDYDNITLAYHFQQGRSDSNGNLLVNDGMDSKSPWLISHGMYGKW